MFIRSISKVLLVLSFVVTAPALAKEEHDHGKGAHGGEVKELGGEFHIEAARKGDKVLIYVLDAGGEKSASLTQHGGGSITVVASGSKPQKSEIDKGSPFSTAEVIVPSSGKVTVLVSVKIGGKSTTTKFVFK